MHCLKTRGTSTQILVNNKKIKIKYILKNIYFINDRVGVIWVGSLFYFRASCVKADKRDSGSIRDH